METIAGTDITMIGKNWLKQVRLDEAALLFAHEYTHKVCGASEDTAMAFSKFITDWISNEPNIKSIFTYNSEGKSIGLWQRLVRDDQPLGWEAYTSLLSPSDPRDYPRSR
jgi:hypothetical protein